MQIYCDEDTARNALDEANAHFNNNLKFKRFTPKSGHLEITLTVKNCRELGGRRSHTGRRIAAACWHAHGEFFRCLPPKTKIRSLGRTFLAGDNWQDWKIGSLAQPLMMSKACDC